MIYGTRKKLFFIKYLKYMKKFIFMDSIAICMHSHHPLKFLISGDTLHLSVQTVMKLKMFVKCRSFQLKTADS